MYDCLPISCPYEVDVDRCGYRHRKNRYIQIVYTMHLVYIIIDLKMYEVTIPLQDSK